MSDSGVGAIGHVLKTAFKDTFSEDELRKKAAELRLKQAEGVTSADDDATLADYYTSFEKMDLYDEFKDVLKQKSSQIESDLVNQSEEASQLIFYMAEEKKKAKALEELEEDDLKRQGVLIGQHIPSLPTKLAVERESLEGYGNYSSNLVVAKELVGQNQENFLRRTGILPISPLAEQRKLERSKKSAAIDEKVAHYTIRTEAASVRESRIAIRYAATTNARLIKLADTESEIKPERKHYPRKKNQLTAHERLENEEILKGINHRLNYLRNPRNDPKSVSRIIVSSTHAENEVAQVEKSTGTSRATGIIVDSNMTPLFQTEPKVVEFSDYEVGGQYSLPIIFRNISAVTRSLRVIPPLSANFTIEPLEYPKASKGGLIATGMAVRSKIVFFPDSVGDYSDTFKVETEGGAYEVPLKAHREAPLLTLKSTLDVGTCLIGDAIRVGFSCSNAGGQGKFRLLRPEDYPEVPTDIDWPAIGCQRFHSFTVYPVEFSLQKNESITLNVEYSPLSLGDHYQEFFLLCDNGEVRKYIINGFCRAVAVAITEINNVSIVHLNSNALVSDYAEDDSSVAPQPNAIIAKDLYFSGAIVGSEQSQSIVVENDTGMPVEFEWVWIDNKEIKNGDGLDFDIAKVAREKIFQREIQELELDKRTPSRSRNSNRRPLTADDFGLSLPPPKSSSVALRTNNSVEFEEEADPILMASIINDEDECPTNASVYQEFKISPGRGTLSSEGAQQFTISFTPSQLSRVGCTLLLMIRNATEASIPNDNQSNAIIALQNNGHGSHHRLCSWLEAIGMIGQVPVYYKPNGQMSNNTNLTNLITLLNLIINHIHVNGEILFEVEDEEREEVSTEIENRLNLLDKWIRKMLMHVYLFRKKELVNEDESSVSVDGEGTDVENQELITPVVPYPATLYDWNGNELNLPEIVPLIHLSNVPDVEETNDGDEDEKVPAERFEFKIEEKQMLSEIWVETPTALYLLGNQICSVLNDLVKHEAIEYVQEHCRTDVPYLSTIVSGIGALQAIQVSPPSITISDNLLIGQQWQGVVTLKNDSPAISEVEINFADIIITDIVTKKTKRYEDEAASDFIIQFEPSRILLMPNSNADISIMLIAKSIGEYKIEIPLIATNNPLGCVLDNILVSMIVGSPKLLFDVCEVDMGLVGTSSSETKEIFVKNTNMCASYIYNIRSIVYEDEETLNSIKNYQASSLPSPKKVSSESIASLGDSDGFNISANIFVENPIGIIEPGESKMIKITCKAGVIAERVRGVIECTIADTASNVPLLIEPAYVSVRAEIQSPKTIMYPLNIQLGTVFIGVPIPYSVTIENLSNLKTNYTLERPVGDSPNYSITYPDYNNCGPLDGKQKIIIRCIFTALLPGAMTDVISNKVFGIQFPLGYMLKYVAKGIQVELVNLSGNQVQSGEIPPPLTNENDLQYSCTEELPEPKPIQPVVFGDGIPLYERCCQYICIRNLTPISSPFSFAIRNFDVLDKSAVDNLHEPTHTKRSSQDPLLTPHEDGLNRYKGEGGKKYLSVTVQREQDRKFLTSSKGCAYKVEPSEGFLPPWGVKVVSIKAYNDMPGNYDDELTFQLVDNKQHKSYTVPLKLVIQGCPLVIEANTLGLSTIRKEGVHFTATDIGKKLLQFGNNCVNCEPVAREFKVKNNGSKTGKLKWRLSMLGSIAKGLIKVELVPNEYIQSDGTTKVVTKVKLPFWSDISKEIPFTVEPNSVSIPPYSSINFSVKLFRTEHATTETAMLIGTVDVKDPINTSLSIENSSTSTAKYADKSQGTYTLTMSLLGSFEFPSVRLDKALLTAVQPGTVVPEVNGVKMKAQAPKLFSRGVKTSDICNKSVTLVNPLDTPLVFTVTTTGPFIVKNSIDDGSGTSKGGKHVTFADAPSKALLSSTVSLGATSRASKGTIVSDVSASSLGKTFNLLPNQSTTFLIAFAPKKDTKEKLLNQISSGAPTEENGDMVVTFSTGQSLNIPVSVKLVTPFITASTPKIDFGSCHTTRNVEGTILLSNPTNVPANWSILHVPGAGSGKRVSTVVVKGYEPLPAEVDDPSVFDIATDNGTVEGPTVSVTAAMAAPPKDFNRLDDNIVVPQRMIHSSWSTSTLTIKDSLDLRHKGQHKNEADAFFPMPINIKFTPKENKNYCSRFRIKCMFGNTFDVVLQGVGTYNENEHRPKTILPK